MEIPSWQSAQPQLSGKRLLVVEDNTTNRRIVTHRGEQWGLVVETATNSRGVSGLGPTALLV